MLMHAKNNNHITKVAKLGTRRLLKSIKGLLQLAHLWLLHVDLIIKIIMKECIFDIKLMESPLKSSSQINNDMDRMNFGHWRKSLIIVDTRSPNIALRSKTHLSRGVKKTQVHLAQTRKIEYFGVRS